jgi:hypothetical protein
MSVPDGPEIPAYVGIIMAIAVAGASVFAAWRATLKSAFGQASVPEVRRGDTVLHMQGPLENLVEGIHEIRQEIRRLAEISERTTFIMHEIRTEVSQTKEAVDEVRRVADENRVLLRNHK